MTPGRHAGTAAVAMGLTSALVSAFLSALACGREPPRPAPPADRAAPGWIPVHEGSDPDHRGSVVRVRVDTAGAVTLPDGARLLWFETRHSVPRVEAGRPFDRELIRIALWCGPGARASAFKTVDALLLSGESPPVYQEGTAVADLERRPWRAVKPGTADSIAFGRACGSLAAAPGGRG